MLEALRSLNPPPSIAAALSEEGAVEYDLSQRRPQKPAKKEEPATPQFETAPSSEAAEEAPPRKASAAPTKGELEEDGVEGFVRPGVSGGKGEAPEPAGATPAGFGLKRGLDSSPTPSGEGSTKAVD